MDLITLLLAVLTAQASTPAGKMIDLDGRRLHLNCTGSGTPTVLIETGLGSFSTEWAAVQARMQQFTRICSYDRGGYPPSDPGPFPRTFAQLNLELHEALSRAGERAPLVLVAHSFGGGVVRAYTERYPNDVAGLVLVDVVSEQQYVRMGPHAGRIADGAKGRAIPEPTLSGKGEGGLAEAENNQREWSSEYFARWLSASQSGTLGKRPLIVLARADGAYPDNLDKPAAELERARLAGQRALATLSTQGSLRLLQAGHDLHVDATNDVVQAIQQVVKAVRAVARP